MRKYFGIAHDTSGNVLTSASISVKLAGTASDATLYSDNAYTNLANPFTNASDGSYQFYASNGRYDVVITKAGYTFLAATTSDGVLYDPSSVISPAQITADQNDYSPTNALNATFWRVTTDATRTLTGIAAGKAQQRIIVSNVGSNNLILANESASSAAANRIITGTSADLTVAADTQREIWYDITTLRWRVLNASAPSATAIDDLTGLTLSNNVADATNDIDVAIGAAASNDAVIASRVFMSLTSALTKKLDVVWAVGTNQGMLDTGAIANATYHIYLIQRVDSGVVDILASTSATAPTMPTNYTKKRRIGSIIRSGGSILAFVQWGDYFRLSTPILDHSAVTQDATTWTSRTLSTPLGIRVFAHVRLGHINVTCHLATRPTDALDGNPSGTVAPLSIGSNLGAGEVTGWEMTLTNTSSQIQTNSSALLTTGLYVATLGWADRREQG